MHSCSATPQNTQYIKSKSTIYLNQYTTQIQGAGYKWGISSPQNKLRRQHACMLEVNYQFVNNYKKKEKVGDRKKNILKIIIVKLKLLLFR